MVDLLRARFPRTILFCADCNRDLGHARNGTLGSYFVCPNEPKDKRHFARVILDQDPAKWWLRREKDCLVFQTVFSPFAVLRKVFPKIQAGAYLFISTVLLFLAIALWNFAVSGLPDPAVHVLHGLVLALVLWRFLDIILSNVSITFTSRFPANPIRSVFFTVIAYVQIALSFALFYLALGWEHFARSVTWESSLFFSFGTITTVGYGDLSPTTNLARSLVVSELILGLVFVASIIGGVVGWTSSSRREAGEYPIEKLKQPALPGSE